MLKASNEERGTIASLAALSHDLDSAQDDGNISFDGEKFQLTVSVNSHTNVSAQPSISNEANVI